MRKQVIYTISPDFHNKGRLEKLYLALSLLRFFQKGFMFSASPVRNRYKLFREIGHCGGGCLRQSVTQYGFRATARTEQGEGHRGKR